MQKSDFYLNKPSLKKKKNYCAYLLRGSTYLKIFKYRNDKGRKKDSEHESPT